MANPSASSAPTPASSSPRLTAIDAYRGFVMFLLMAEQLHVPQVAKNFPDSPFWQTFFFHTEHVEWTGCSLHDMIQPSFTFLVGVALPFSIASRRKHGQSMTLVSLHALWRSVLLVLLGVFLRSMYAKQTNWTFDDTLTQIGFGYFFLFLLGLTTVRWQLFALAVLLIGYWAAFAAYRLPGPEFSYPAVGVPADWPHLFSGFEAHWNKNSNPAWAFDTWFMNLFPRPKPFMFSDGGYATLSFIPTLGTMILGLFAGEIVRLNDTGWRKVGWLVAAAAGCLAVGYGVAAAGLCPSVKRIWTPTWTLVSGGYCFLFLAGFYAVLENLGVRAWSYPLLVIGRNSIAIYVLLHQFPGFLLNSLKIHLGQNVFTNAAERLASFVIQDPTPEQLQEYGLIFGPMLGGAAVLLILWGILFWMDRRKIYIKL